MKNTNSYSRVIFSSMCAILFLGILLFIMPNCASAQQQTTSSRCDQYARTAVSQNEENIRRQCGYTGARWHNNYQGHYGWCLDPRTSQDRADSETKAREDGLEKCRAQQGQPQPQQAPVTMWSDVDFVTSLYRTILDREPDAGGLQHWVEWLRKGQSREWVITQFFSSAEYQSRRKNDSEFVRDLYQAVLGREPDPGGWNNWVDMLRQGMSRQDCLNRFFQSAEYTNIRRLGPPSVTQTSISEVDWNNKPWLDPRVIRCVREYLDKVLVMVNEAQQRENKPPFTVLDDWGRLLRPPQITAHGGVDGNWDNPTHFVWGAYNTIEHRNSPLGGVQDYVRECVRRIGGPGPTSSTPQQQTTSSRCDQYARTAVSKNEENIRRQCGYSGPRWNSYYKSHYDWCVRVSKDSADSETKAREDGLRACRERQRQAPGDGGAITGHQPPFETKTYDIVGRNEILKGDGVSDWMFAITLRAEGRIKSITVQNTTGEFSVWDTIPGNRFWLLGVTTYDKDLLNGSDGSIDYYVKGKTNLYLLAADNGSSLKLGKTSYKVIIEFTDGRVLERNVGSASAQAPEADQDTRWLVDRVWQFGRGDGTPLADEIRLRPGGKIEGYSHPNEFRWGLEGNTLVFYHRSGKPTTRFTTVRTEDGRMVLSGPFIPNPQLSHVLREVASQQPQSAQPPGIPGDQTTDTAETAQQTTSTRCDQYARTAVSLNEENIRRQCGYTGPRWSSNYKSHYDWCVRVSKDFADSETKAREDGLEKCRAQQGQPQPQQAPITMWSDVDFVTSLYRTILDREPDAGGLQNWVEWLRKGQSREWVITQFFSSAEYQSRRKNDSEFVRDLYQAVLGREPDPSGWNNWVDMLRQGMSRQDCLNRFFQSAEYTNLRRLGPPSVSQTSISEVDWNNKPWLDPRVIRCVREYLDKVLVMVNEQQRRKNEPPFTVLDDWGRLLRPPQITAHGGVDGNWDNPTHFVWGAYNTIKHRNSPLGGVQDYVRECVRRIGVPGPILPTPQPQAGVNPWDTPEGRACFEQWIREATAKMNAYNGSDDYNARKPWSINRYGILEGNPKYGPTSVRAPDNWSQYNANKYWYMWDYWHAPSGIWGKPHLNAAGVPHIRPYVLECLRQAGVTMDRTAQQATFSRCDQYARTAVSQNEENIRRQCGYTGPRWSSNYQGHYDWCLGVSKDSADSETKAREDGLRACRERQGEAPGDGGAITGHQPPFETKTYDIVGRNETLKGDGVPDWMFAITLRAKGTIKSITVRNTNGEFSVWDTKPGNGYWLLGVTTYDKRVLNGSKGDVNIKVSGKTNLYLLAADNGSSLKQGKTSYKVIIEFTDGRVLERNVGSASAQAPEADQDTSWLVDRVWQFGRGDGRVYADTIRLRPGGKIEGYSHDNESRWGLEGNTLVFYHKNGTATTRFTTVRREDGRMVLSGPFIPNPQLSHVLREVVPQQLPVISGDQAKDDTEVSPFDDSFQQFIQTQTIRDEKRNILLQDQIAADMASAYTRDEDDFGSRLSDMMDEVYPDKTDDTTADQGTTGQDRPGSGVVEPVVPPGDEGEASTDERQCKKVSLNPGAWRQLPNHRGLINTGQGGLILHGDEWTNGRLKNGKFDGNGVESNTEYFDFNNGGDVYMTFKVNDGGKYLGISPKIFSEAGYKLLTTDHTWAGSVVVPNNIPLYAHFKVDQNGKYKTTVSQGNYDDKGGSTISEYNGTLKNKKGRVRIRFVDNYAGTKAYLVILHAEVCTQLIKADVTIPTEPSKPPPEPAQPPAVVPSQPEVPSEPPIKAPPSKEVIEWHSLEDCGVEAYEGQEYKWRWSIKIVREGSKVSSGSIIYFHKCPGQGRVAYSLSGEVLKDGSFKTEGKRSGGRGSLYSIKPPTQDFILKKGKPPEPNFTQ